MDEMIHARCDCRFRFFVGWCRGLATLWALLACRSRRRSGLGVLRFVTARRLASAGWLGRVEFRCFWVWLFRWGWRYRLLLSFPRSQFGTVLAKRAGHNCGVGDSYDGHSLRLPSRQNLEDLCLSKLDLAVDETSCRRCTGGVS